MWQFRIRPYTEVIPSSQQHHDLVSPQTFEELLQFCKTQIRLEKLRCSPLHFFLKNKCYIKVKKKSSIFS